MAANHVLDFIEGTFFFFSFLKCAYGKEQKEQGCEFRPYIPLQ